MTDKIDGTGMRPVDSGATRRAAESARSAASAAKAETAERTKPSEAAADKVELTPSAVLLQRLEEQVRSLPDVDAERVRAIKESIAAGEYRVDNERVAENLARLDRDLA